MLNQTPLTSRLIVALAGLSLSFSAWPHVKWFAEYDLTVPPLPIGEVMTTEFIYLHFLSICCIYVFFWLDRYLFRRNYLGGLASKLTLSRELSLRIVSIAAVVFFVALAIYGFRGNAFLLTPELHTDAAFIPWFQLVLAVCALFPMTRPITGFGIATLYVIGISSYGIFHMLDYMIFIGLAVYFLFSRMTSLKWTTFRYATLFAATGLTLLWAAIEKWGYPYWTYPLLESDPSLLLGMSPHFYMLFAGFVEFNLTFILFSSASILTRIVAFGLNMIFILAIYKFGLVDAVGHLLIITILAILVLRGPTRARYFLVLGDKSLWTEAYFMTGLYILAFNVVFMSYYGIYHLTYG
jgi:hypothetical protein